MKIARNRTVARRRAAMRILCAASLCLGAGVWAGSARAVWSEIPLPDGVATVRAIEIGRVYVWIAATDGAGNDLGVYRSPLVAPDSWASLGFAGSGVHGFAVGGIADERVLIASWDDPPLYYSSDCGGTWVPRSGSMDGRLVTELAGTEAGSARVYAASRSAGGAAGWQGLSTSIDFGLTWSNWSYCENCVMNGIGWISVDPANPDRAHGAVYDGFWQTFGLSTGNGGTSWSQTGIGEGGIPVGVAAAAGRFDLYYILGSTSMCAIEGASTTWLDTPGAWNGNFGITGAAWDAEAIYLAGIEGNAPNANGPVRVYRGTGLPDSPTWDDISDGLPAAASPHPAGSYLRYHIASAPQMPALFVTAPGLGLWMLAELDAASVEPAAPSSQPVRLTLPQPNPARTSVACGLTPPFGDPAVLEILDVTGALVASKSIPAGASVARWDGHRSDGGIAASGIYYLRVRNVEGVSQRKFLWIR